jgi:hypothetical protein
MDAFVIVGASRSGKSSLARCLTGAGSGKSRTKQVATVSGATINLYVHYPSLQEDWKKTITPANFMAQVAKENPAAVMFALWPYRGRHGYDADAYLQHFIQNGWHIVRVAFLGLPLTSITTTFQTSVAQSFPRMPQTPANTIAVQVRQHFGWL